MEHPEVDDHENNDGSLQHNDHDNKNFVLWLTSGKRAYPGRVARRFIRNMYLVPPRLDISLESQARDVFRCKTVIELDQLWSAYKAAPNYENINNTSNRGAFATALYEYRCYLSDIQNHHQQTLVDQNNHARQSNSIQSIFIEDNASTPSQQLLPLARDLKNKASLDKKSDYKPPYFDTSNLASKRSTFGEYCKMKSQAYDKTPLSELKLSIRSESRLKCMASTIADVMNLKIQDVLKIPGFGALSINEVVTAIISLPRTNSAKTQPTFFSDVIGELSNELIPYKNEILKGNWDFLNTLELSEHSLKQLNLFRQGRLIVGPDLLHICLQSPNGMQSIVQALDDFHKIYVQKKARTEELNKLFYNIPQERHNLKASYFVDAKYPNNQPTRDLVKKFFGDENGKLSDALAFCPALAEPDYHLLEGFLKWCSFSIDDELDKLLVDVFQNERDIEIIRMRSDNHTLSEVGEVFQLTRERVRQVEVKVTKRFSACQNKINTLLKISALRNGDTILTEVELKPYFVKHTESILYMFKITPNTSYTFCKDLNVFIVGNDEVSQQVECYVESLPDQIEQSSLDKIIASIEDEHGLPVELFEIQIADNYSRQGQIYHRGRLSKIVMYDHVMRKYYPEGIHVYDTEALEQFRKHVREEYGDDIPLSETDRALSARLGDLGLLCGRGIYRPKQEKYISQSLADRILNHITNDESSIFIMNTL